MLDRLEQAHGARVGYQRRIAFANAHHPSVRKGWRVSSNASTKLLTTPAATVIPIARSTGRVESASSANTTMTSSAAETARPHRHQGRCAMPTLEAVEDDLVALHLQTQVAICLWNGIRGA